MESGRNSTSSNITSLSASLTACNPNSAQTSPKISGHGEQRASSITSASSSSNDSTSDNEDGGSLVEKEPVQGWPKLARIMADVPEFAAFSRFKDLNTKNLLYYQAQLKAIRHQILEQEQLEIAKSGRADRLMNDEDSKLFNLIMKMRGLLREYNEALLQYSQISALPDPEAYNMQSLRNWLIDEDDGAAQNVCDWKGPDDTWGNLDAEIAKVPPSLWEQLRKVLKALVWAQPPPKDEALDLVVTHPQMKIDGLTKWTVYYVVPFWWALRDNWRKKKSSRLDEEKSTSKREKPTVDLTKEEEEKKKKKEKRKKEKTLESMSEATALRFTSSLSTVIACLIPVVAIAVLSQLHGTRDILLCITGFAVIFAVGLIFLTQGTSTRTEIFAATAAFSAVMVVFISQPTINVPPGGSVET
ncbi:hypothetical protein V2W45_1348020 [Cenococcum geophilum]